MITVLIIVTAVIAALVAVVVLIALFSDNTICNYCNADGDPCPRCGGSTLR